MKRPEKELSFLFQLNAIKCDANADKIEYTHVERMNQNGLDTRQLNRH